MDSVGEGEGEGGKTSASPLLEQLQHPRHQKMPKEKGSSGLPRGRGLRQKDRLGGSKPPGLSLPLANSLECGNLPSSLFFPGFQDLLERTPCAFVSGTFPVLGLYWFSA